MFCLDCFGWCFFFFKQKTAYELRISDWSSDVCSSDLVSPYAVAAIAISLHMGALMTEVFRGGLLALPRSQADGGLALGMTPLALMREVLLPQALRVALPPYVSLIPVTVNATSLASVISIWELTLASKEIATRTLDTFEVFAVAYVIYFAICYRLEEYTSEIQSLMRNTNHVIR